ncbi:MAG: ComF family protein [Chthoniobacteraceae bacterium]
MGAAATARRFFSALGTLCFPPFCAACRVATEPGIHLCADCAESAQRIVAPFCRCCSQPFDGAITQQFTCSNCTGRELHFECAVAAYLSRGVVRDFIHAFKYERQFHLRRPLAEWLSLTLDDPRISSRPFDAFVPVPLHHVRFREREFNQAAELATLVSQRCGIPVWNALKRTRYTSTQTKLDRAERMENLRGAFRVRHSACVKERHLVLVDDVFTTGSTVEECSRVLLRAGAASVRVITVARG